MSLYYSDAGAYSLLEETTLRAHTLANRPLVRWWNPLPLLLAAHGGKVHPPESPESNGHLLHVFWLPLREENGRNNGKTRVGGGGGEWVSIPCREIRLRAWNQRWLLSLSESCSPVLLTWKFVAVMNILPGIEEASLDCSVFSCTSTQGRLNDSTDGWLDLFFFFFPVLLLYFFLMKFIACVIGFHCALAGFHNLLSVHSGDKSAPRKSFWGIIAEVRTSPHLGFAI